MVTAADDDQVRGNVYALLGHLLSAPPEAGVLESLAAIEPAPDGESLLTASWQMLGEAATRATLVAYGTDPGVAVSYAVGYHITTFIPITLLGLWSLARAHLHLADLGRRDARDDAVPAAAPSAN